MKEINPVESIDLNSVEKLRLNKHPDIRGLRQSTIIQEYESLCKNLPFNCSIISTLKALINANAEDASEFERWDKDCDVEYRSSIVSDIKRCSVWKRPNHQQLGKYLLQITVFYCENSNVEYTQGMLDIVIPFLYLKSKHFALKEVYSHVKKFMKVFIHNTIHSSHDGKQKWLPYLHCSLTLCQILLKYHDIELFNHLKKYQIKMEFFCTGWILTNFSRLVQFPLVYELIEIILYERDELLALYFVIALLKIQKNRILKCKSAEEILTILYKLTKIDTAEKLSNLYY